MTFVLEMGYNEIVDTADLKEITGRLDEIISLLKDIGKAPSMARRIVDGIATGAGILGIISAADVIKMWIGG
jgi:hypothetical protein